MDEKADFLEMAKDAWELIPGAPASYKQEYLETAKVCALIALVDRLDRITRVHHLNKGRKVYGLAVDAFVENG